MRSFLILLIFLTSCTSYSAGVESSWVRPNMLQVSGSGNAFSTDGRIENYVFLQAAEKALAAGYRYFIVAENNNTGSTETFTTYTPYTTTVSGHSSGTFTGNTYHGSSTARATTTGGPQSYTYYFPSREAVFLMYDDIPAGYRPSQFYDAVLVYNELGPKHISDFVPVTQKPVSTSYSAPRITPEPTTKDAPQSESNSTLIATEETHAPQAQSKKEKTLDEIYNGLSDEEKFYADNLPPAERTQYLYNRR